MVSPNLLTYQNLFECFSTFAYCVAVFFFCVCGYTRHFRADVGNKNALQAYHRRTESSPTSAVAVCIALVVALMSSDVCKSQPIKKPPVITYAAGPNQLTLLFPNSAFRYTFFFLVCCFINKQLFLAVYRSLFASHCSSTDVHQTNKQIWIRYGQPIPS